MKLLYLVVEIYANFHEHLNLFEGFRARQALECDIRTITVSYIIKQDWNMQ